MNRLSWAGFAADWAAQTAEARAAAAALRAGRVAPLLDRCLDPHPALRAAGLRALQVYAEIPDPADLDAAPPPEDPSRLASPFEHRVGLYARSPGPHGGLVWALRELALLSGRLEAIERRGWGEPAPPDPRRDFATATCWASWGAGNLWPHYGTFAGLFLPAARRAFQSVLAARAVPVHARQAALSELPSAFCTVMLADKAAIPGILDVGLRLLERDARGPLLALARLLPEDGWTQTGACLASRGAWARTLREIWSAGLLPASRGALTAARGQTDPAFLESVVDLHGTFRLLALWAEGRTHPRLSWRVLRQNRGKVRGRLRALLAERLGREIAASLLAREGLYARTWEAVTAFSLTWAWEEVRAGLPMNPDNAVTPRCALPEPGLTPLDRALDGLTRTWVLLVVLRGRLAHLQTWVETGQQRDGDSVFGRLLSEALPDALIDPAPDGVRGYRRLRDALGVNLGEHLTALLPTFHALAALPSGRGLNRLFEDVLRPIWDRRICFPKRDFPEMQRMALAASRGAGPSEEDPWSL